MKEGTIVGYGNPNNYFPTYIIIVYEDGKGYSARYPSGAEYKINESFTVDDIKEMKGYLSVSENDKGVLDTNDIGFAFSEKEIIVGPFELIKQKIEEALAGNTVTEHDEKILRLLLVAG